MVWWVVCQQKAVQTFLACKVILNRQWLTGGEEVDQWQGAGCWRRRRTQGVLGERGQGFRLGATADHYLSAAWPIKSRSSFVVVSLYSHCLGWNVQVGSIKQKRGGYKDQWLYNKKIYTYENGKNKGDARLAYEDSSASHYEAIAIGRTAIMS
ncbi:uncharacterized protein LOC144549601 [Carex rostrata]